MDLTRFFSLGVVYVLLSLIQSAVLEDAAAGSTGAEVCPSLSDQSVRILCHSASGPMPCQDAQVGVKARAFWRKTVVTARQKVGDTTLVCQSPGVWVVDNAAEDDGKDKDKGKGMDGGDKDKGKGVDGGRKDAPLGQAATTIANAATVAFKTPPATTTAKPVPSGYVNVDGYGLYKYYKSGGNAVDANNTCTAEGSRILVVDSRAEIVAIYKKLLESKMDDFRGIGLFVGVTEHRNGLFYTEFGAPFPGNSGLKWGSNEPSRRSDEGCVFIDIPGYDAHDAACRGHNANFVCERPLK